MLLTEALDAGQLDVPVVVLLVRALVRQHLDARFLGPLEDGLERHGVVRHHGDHVDLARDQVLDRPHLLRRIGLGRADHRGVDAELLALLLDADLHGVEPGDAADLHHGDDLGRIGGEDGAGQGEHERGGRSQPRKTTAGDAHDG